MSQTNRLAPRAQQSGQQLRPSLNGIELPFVHHQHGHDRELLLGDLLQHRRARVDPQRLLHPSEPALRRSSVDSRQGPEEMSQQYPHDTDHQPHDKAHSDEQRFPRPEWIIGIGWQGPIDDP
jgi:hypothetical protein